MKKTTLTTAEQKLARYITEARKRNNETLGVREQYVAKEKKAENELNGVAGEIAFCKMFNVYPDLMIGHWDYKDAMYNGHSIDIKTVSKPNLRLICKRSKEKKQLPDYYALMFGVFPEYEFKGFITSNNFINDEHLEDLGHGLTFVAEHDELEIEI